MQRQGETGRLAVLAAIVIAVVLGAFVLVNEFALTSAEEPDAEMSLVGESGGATCNTDEYCVVLSGAFTLAVVIDNAPDAGYIFAGAWVNYGDHLIYKPITPASNEIIWPDCQGATALRNQTAHGTENHVALGCLTGLIPPLPLSTYVGNFWELPMTCSASDSSTLIRLLPEGDVIAGTSGALFKAGASGISVVPKVSDLFVVCGSGGDLATDTPTITNTPAPVTDTPTNTPAPATDTPVPLPPVIVDSTSGLISGFFGSVDFPEGFSNGVQDVIFSEPLPTDDYVVLLTRVNRSCLPFHVVEQRTTGFSFQTCGDGGSVNWAVLAGFGAAPPADGHHHWACRQIRTGELRDTGVDTDSDAPRCARGWELIQIVVNH